ncbi:MAG: acyl-CoA thioesterase-1 [Arenicella sp.]|jgi:acyl-CoA thioesterase-1
MIPNQLKDKFTFALFALLFFIISPSAQAKHLVIFGDSLSAAYGMELEQGWAHLLAESIKRTHKVTNASISGETSGGGLARLAITLAELKPDVMLIELGANDGLQGLPISALRENLEKIILMVKKENIAIALAGISLPATYGPRYIDKFRSTFKELSLRHELPFIDFYREEFFLQADFIQQDGLHPTAKTQPIVKDIVLDFLIDNKLLD